MATYYKIGFTQGTFDTLHYGHINLLKNAKERCDILYVGVNSDRLVKEYKNKETIIKEHDRLDIVKAIRYVDEAFIVDTLDKIITLNKIHFDVIFIGDDWKDNERWKKTEADLSKLGVDVVFLPHTEGISSSYVKDKMKCF